MLFRSPDNGNTIDQLELLPVVETTWGMWKELYPETKVISGRTGFNRDYTLYPYSNYRSANTSPLFPLQTASLDERFPAKHMVLGLIESDVQKAYPFSVISANPVNNDVVNGREVLVISNPTFKLAIPYDRTVDGQVLSFELVSREPFRMTDNETGSVWNMKGEAISGQLSGAKLNQIPAHNAFWFAWAVFWPQTQVLGE